MISLSSIASISAGHSFRGKVTEKQDSGIYAIQMKDISEEEGLNRKSVIETSLSSKREPDWLRAGDILFVGRGYCIFATVYDGAFKHAVASPHFFVIRIQSDQAIPEFVAWQLNQLPAQRYFDREAEGSVAKSIKRSTLERASLSLPSLKEQETILNLHKNLHEQKLIYRELIKSADKTMKNIALNLEHDFISNEVKEGQN